MLAGSALRLSSLNPPARMPSGWGDKGGSLGTRSPREQPLCRSQQCRGGALGPVGRGPLAVSSLLDAFKTSGLDPIWTESKWKERKRAGFPAKWKGWAAASASPRGRCSAHISPRGAGRAAARLSEKILLTQARQRRSLGAAAHLLCANPRDPRARGCNQTAPCPPQQCPCVRGKALAAAVGVMQAAAWFLDR